MASSDEFVCNRSVRSLDMLFGVVTSILLHSILLIGSKYWQRALMREPNTAQVPNYKKIAVAAITTPPPAQLGKTALERATTLPVPSNPKKLGQSRTRLSERTPS
ncbi:hypothetical protein [uncultured Nostoc sp.]|uniref:hypothetical protein n=1 Tax=uncultured Nostoc sp. TaxID=340711 RepID=UPI0035CC99B4